MWYTNAQYYVLYMSYTCLICVYIYNIYTVNIYIYIYLCVCVFDCVYTSMIINYLLVPQIVDGDARFTGALFRQTQEGTIPGGAAGSDQLDLPEATCARDGAVEDSPRYCQILPASC